MIFNDVSQFYWLYGNSFTVTNNAESIATIDSKTVAALYNGTEHGKGNFIAFGDLYWIYDEYDSTSYNQDHSNLLNNIIEFFLPSDEVSINIELEKESTPNSEIIISTYLKNQTSESPITNYTSLNVSINNEPYSTSIILNTTFSDDGIYFNNSYNLPYPSYLPYLIEVNLTIGSKVYSKITKILYFNQSEVPQINDLTSDLPIDDLSITRAFGDSTNLIADVDKPTNGSIEGYLSIYSYSFYNFH